MNIIKGTARRRVTVDIKLLRLELVAHGKTPCDQISHEWSPAQPTENLSPEKAAAILKVEEWAPQSVVRERYRKLQMRYPPEQFPLQHNQMRPAYELLSSPVVRLNWYWQSGLIPVMTSALSESENNLWNRSVSQTEFTAAGALDAVIQSMLLTE